MSVFNKNDSNGLVQPIIVMNTGSHENVVTGVALACYISYGMRNNPQAPVYDWDKWLAGPFTKSVRRADEKLWKKIKAEHSCVSASIGTGEDASLVMAFGPMETPFPKPIQRCQVTGTEMPRRGWDTLAINGFFLAINPDVVMSTGKTAAQVAHAYLGYAIAFPDAEFSIRITNDPEVFNTLKNENIDNKIMIKDAGFTEIEPGTLTVIAGVL